MSEIKETQPTLLNLPEWWREHWQDMPEFEQETQTPFTEIIVRFESEDDLQEFAKIIEQNLTRKTQSIWHPKLEAGKYVEKRWRANNES